MTPLVTKEIGGGPRKNLNLRTDLNPDLSPVEALRTVSIVVPITNVDSALHVGKFVNHVVKRTILPKSVGLGKAKAKAKAPVVQSISHLNAGR